MNTEGGRNVTQIIFKAGCEDPVIPIPITAASFPCSGREAVIGHHSHPARVIRVVGHRHSTFAGSDRLVCVKRKARDVGGMFAASLPDRSEERRVGKECRSRGSTS